MAVETGQTPHESLADAAKSLAAGLPLRESLALIAAAAAESTGAALAAVRVLDPDSGAFVVRAAAPTDSPLAAELVGSQAGGDELEPESDDEGRLLVWAFVGDRVAGALELLGADDTARPLAELAAAQLALVQRRRLPEPAATLERLGDALAAGATLTHAARHAAWVAAEASGADGAALWRARDGLELLAVHGEADVPALERRRELAAAALEQWQPLAVDDPESGVHVVSIQLGQPAFGVLQLVHREELPAHDLEPLAAFAVRAAHALRAGERARELELELERTQALLSVVGEAIS